MLLSPELRATLPKVLLPGVALLVVTRLARRRYGPDWRRELRLVRPERPGEAVLWVAGYAAFMLATNAVMYWRGPWDFAPWVRQGPLISVMRVLAVGFLGPVLEELIVRGMLYDRLVRTRLGVVGAVTVLAALWAAVHSYAMGVIALLFVCGLLLGAARYRTGSVLVPIAMHIVWNLYAVW